MAYLYILGLIDKKCYCGITNNIVKRIMQHNLGMSKSTKYRRPVVLKYLKEFKDMKEARVMEVKVKSEGVSRWMLKNVTYGKYL